MTFTGPRDMFVIRYDSNLENPRKTFLGGDVGGGDHQGRNSMFVYGNGEVLISGGTDCTDYPKNNTPAGSPIVKHRADASLPSNTPVVQNPGNFDAFLTKLDANGAVAWTTFLGSEGDESAYTGVAVDASGAIYIAGNTNLHKVGTAPPVYWPGALPTSAGSFQATYQGGTNSGLHHSPAGDGFVARFTAAGTLSWVTYLGGSDVDGISGNDGLHVAGDGTVYVVGATKSANFPVSAVVPPGGDPPPPFDWTHSDPGVSSDGFVTSLFSTPTSTSLNRSTLIGGFGDEELGGIEVDHLGRVHFVGNTRAPTGNGATPYPTTSDAYQVTKSGYGPGQGGPGLDGLYTVMDFDLSMLLYSTYMGSMSEALPEDRGRALDLLRGKVFIAGDTESANFFPVGTALGFQQTPSAADDGFLTRFTW